MDYSKVKKEVCIILVFAMLYTLFVGSSFLAERMNSSDDSVQAQEFLLSVPQKLDLRSLGSAIDSVRHVKEYVIANGFRAALEHAFADMNQVHLLSILSDTALITTLKHKMLTLKNKLKTTQITVPFMGTSLWSLEGIYNWIFQRAGTFGQLLIQLE